RHQFGGNRPYTGPMKPLPPASLASSPSLDAAPANDNDAAAAIAFIRGLAPPVQARVRDALAPAPRLHRWVSVATAQQLIELLPDLPPEDQRLVEVRLLPPWMRQERRLERRDAAIRALAGLYLDPAPTAPTGCRALARAI